MIPAFQPESVPQGQLISAHGKAKRRHGKNGSLKNSGCKPRLFCQDEAGQEIEQIKSATKTLKHQITQKSECLFCI
jgi:hypothetical protein